jgi:hypothetical protein
MTTNKVEMKRFSDHKAVVRFKAVDESNAAIRDVYISRGLAGVSSWQNITITIEGDAKVEAKLASL